MIAILPAAGKGTRMSTVSDGPKELLEVGGQSVLKRVVEEAKSAGASEIAIVVSPLKPEVTRFAESVGAAVAVQEIANGLAPAVTQAARFGPALILLPDTIFHPSAPTVRLVDALNRGYDIAVAIERVSDEDVSRYGIVEWNPDSGRISRILEKPDRKDTASRWAIAARFGISNRTLFFLRERVDLLKGQLGEIDLPPLLSEAIDRGHAAIAIPLEPNERRLDCGNPDGYRHACEVFDASI